MHVHACVCIRVRYLHSVGGVLVVEDEGLLDELVVPLQLVDVGLVLDDALLVLPQVGQLVLQRAVHLDGYPADLLQHKHRGLTFLGGFHTLIYYHTSGW